MASRSAGGLRIGIAAKIFGGMFALVLIMAAAAWASMLLVRQVTHQLTTVEGSYLPIAREVASARSAAFEQEVQFERALGVIKGFRDGEPDAAVALFQDLGGSVDRHIESALAALDPAEASTKDMDQRIALVRFEAELMRLAAEHQDIEDEGMRILALLRTGEATFGEALLTRLRREQAEFEQAVRDTARAAADLAADAAADALAKERQVLKINAALTLMAALLGLSFALLIVRGLTRPVRELVTATHRIEEGDLEVQVPVVTRDEIGDLASSFNHMAGELRTKERIKETFGRYVDPRIVDSLLGEDAAAATAGRSAVYTVYFSDVTGFTGIAERLTPSGLVNLINAYLAAMSDPLVESRAIIDKYIGDAIMAFWGPPFTNPGEHARLACTAALAQQHVLAAFQARVPGLTGLRRDFPLIAARIGIATGEVVVGSIGSEVTRNYTVMGDTVNLAARLETLNKVYGTRILVSEATEREARDDFLFREIDSVAVVGKEEAVRIFELVAPAAAAGDRQRALRDAFEDALRAFREQDWDAAEAGFDRCQTLEPGDGPARVHLERIALMRSAPPGPGWSGVWHADAK